MEVGVKTDAWLRAAWCAATLCSAAAAQAAPDCAAPARPPSWAECAADVSLGAPAAGAAFDGPLQLRFDDDGAAVASMDFSMLAVELNGSSQPRAETPSTAAAIPEPQTNLLMVAGLAAIAFMAMRRRRP
jgi:PEP-CTERM motif